MAATRLALLHSPALGLLDFSVTGAAACPTVLISQQNSQSQGLLVLHIRHAQPRPGAPGPLCYRCCSVPHSPDLTAKVQVTGAISPSCHVCTPEVRVEGTKVLRVMSAQPCPEAPGLLFHRCCSFTTVLISYQRSESKGLQVLCVMSAQPCPGASGLLFHGCCSFTTVLISYQSSESKGLYVMYAQPRPGLLDCSVTECSNMHHCPGLGSALTREEEEAHGYRKHGCTALRWVFWTVPSQVLRHAPPSCSWKRLDTLDPR